MAPIENNAAGAAKLIVIDGVTYGGSRPHTSETLKMWEEAMAGLKNNGVTTGNYFGGCPQCGKGSYLNIRKSHYGVCETHKVYWPIGSGLFSSWHEEDQEVWDKNAKMLEGFTQVKPIYPADHIANLPDVSPRIVIKDNNTSTHEPCAICRQDHKPDCGPELFLEGTWDSVCYQCGKKYAPHLAEALELLRKAEQAENERRQRKDALLKHYAAREPNSFVQFDGWLDADDVMGRDEDGHGVTG